MVRLEDVKGKQLTVLWIVSLLENTTINKCGRNRDYFISNQSYHCVQKLLWASDSVKNSIACEFCFLSSFSSFMNLARGLLIMLVCAAIGDCKTAEKSFSPQRKKKQKNNFSRLNLYLTYTNPSGKWDHYRLKKMNHCRCKEKRCMDKTSTNGEDNTTQLFWCESIKGNATMQMDMQNHAINNAQTLEVKCLQIIIMI